MADDDFGLFSYKIFRNFAKKYAKELFKDLEDDLQKAGMKLTIEEYFSELLLIECIVVPVFLICGFFLVNSLVNNIIIALIMSFIFSIIVMLAIFTFFYIKPTNTVQDRSKKIDNSIHFASLYMATLATSGTPPFLIFKVLSEFNEFGEISIIARRISEEVELFGYSLPESLAKQANIVPNKNLSELLWGIRASIISGGDLNVYLNDKSKNFVNQFKRRIEEYSNTMGMFMEMYITVVIVGTIFVIVLSTIMGLIGGMVEQVQIIQTLFVALGVPFVTAAFIIILKTISPTEV